jgi:hypothetical protein
LKRDRRRRRWRLLACGWLTLQLAGFLATPVAICSAHAGAASSHHQTKCCPGIAPGQLCPMHHAREGERTCVMRATCGHGDAALLSLFAVAGLPSHRAIAVYFIPTADRVEPLTSAPIARVDIPDSPPPRA